MVTVVVVVVVAVEVLLFFLSNKNVGSRGKARDLWPKVKNVWEEIEEWLVHNRGREEY